MTYVPTPDATPANPGIYLAQVTRVTGTVCYVEAPQLAAGFEYGPAPYPDYYADPTEPAGQHSHSAPGGATSSNGQHTHPANPLAAGDRVVIAFIGGNQDDGVVVLLRLA